MTVVIIDTGPLVSLLASRDRHHLWAVDALRVRARVVTCEAVISEAFFLLRSSPLASAALRKMLTPTILELIPLSSELGAIAKLMERYSSVPMSFADVCIVRLSEILPEPVVATLDADFEIYRRHGRQVIPLLKP